MKIKNVIIHNLRKEGKGSATIDYSAKSLDLHDKKCQSLIEELYSFFSKSIKYGIFSSDEETIFHTKFDDYLCNSQEKFVSFSRDVLPDLKSRVDSIHQSKGGYIIFSEIENQNTNFFVVFVVRDKTGKQFSYKNNEMKINEVIHIDTNKLAMACRINIQSYQEQKDRYLSFLSTTQEEASKYFINWIGAEALSKSYEDTKNFRKLINKTEPPKDENGNSIGHDELRRRVQEICSKTYSNNINLRAVAEEVWGDPDYLTRVAENNSIVINDIFVADKSELKKLTGLSFTGDKIKLTFPLDYIGDKVRIDENNPNMILIKSDILAEQIREELK